jgi:hypothetical protein
VNLYELAHASDEVIAFEMDWRSSGRKWVCRTETAVFDMLNENFSDELPIDMHATPEEFRMHLLFVHWATTL